MLTVECSIVSKSSKFPLTGLLWKIMENMTKLGSLRPHQDELQQMGELAGVFMDRRVFWNIVKLLNMGIDAETIYNLLKTIKRSRNPKSRTSLLLQKLSSNK